MNPPPDLIGAEQLRLIERSREFIRARAAQGVDVALDPQCYLNSWAPCLGNARLRELAFGARARPARMVARARDVVGLMRFRPAALAGEDSGAGGEFANLIVSWAMASDFDTEGHYRDRYLNLGSRDLPRTLWFLILVSGGIPARLAGNVRVLHRPAPGVTPRTVARNLSGWSRAATEAHEIATFIERCQRRHGFMRVLMPYEAQPFQHAVNLALKARDPRMLTVGYLHSSLPAVPTDYLFRAGAPDRLLVHGAGQAEILARHLGWSRESIEVIDSLRYLRHVDAPFAGNILLPYAFEDADFIAARIEAMLASARPASMPRWKVRNHPVKKDSTPHLALVARLEELIDRYADRASVETNAAAQTLMIGATAAVIEALERGFDVVHLCANPLFELQSPRIWTHLVMDELAPNVYRYRMLACGAYIRLGTASALTARSLGFD